jgi:WD40 repeat protein
VVIGSSVRSAGRRPVPLDWQPGLIRNCSYSSAAGWIGISGEDRTNGGWVLSIFDVDRKVTAHRFPFAYVLHHSLLASGEWACVARPSATPMVADLDVIEISSGRLEMILRGGVHQGSELSWSPDGGGIAFQSPDDRVQIVDRSRQQVVPVADGAAPAVSPEGDRIAFRRSDGVFIWERPTGRTQRVAGGQVTPSTGLSWSPDSRCLTYGCRTGLTGKKTRFYLQDLDTGRRYRLPLRYMTGLVLLPSRIMGTSLSHGTA